MANISTVDDRAVLFAGEQLREVQGHELITYFRAPRAGEPLVVFLAGGGHLARIIYGYPQGSRQDFLDHHLSQRGYGLLALSHALDHPVFTRIDPDITVSQWSACAAQVTFETVRELIKLPPIILLVWSMSGRLVRTFSSESARLGLSVRLAVAMAAGPPLPGSYPIDEAVTPPSSKGLRALVSGARSPFPADWLAALREQDALNGRVLIPAETYLSRFIGDNPVNLHGDVLRSRKGRWSVDIAAAAADLEPFDYANYPLVCALAPTARSDARLALTSAANWGSFQVNALFARLQANTDLTRLDEARWSTLRALLDRLPRRFSHRINGSHFFFVGDYGAALTARRIAHWHADAVRFECQIEALCPNSSPLQIGASDASSK